MLSSTSYMHSTAFRRELKRIAQQVIDNLFYTEIVTQNLRVIVFAIYR